MSNDSTRSTISSTKNAYGEDFESSTSSSLSSTYSSSCRSSFGVDDVNKEQKNNLVHLDNINKYKKQLNTNDSLESSHNIRTKRLEQHLPQSRRFNSAPAFITKRLSSKLQSIEENDEHGSSSTSSTGVCKNFKNIEKEGKDGDTRMELEELRTPRFYEVPPKKICIRKKTPEMDIPNRNVSHDLSKHMNECWKGDNKRITIGDKEYILRKVHKIPTTTVSTQIDKDFLKEVNSSKKHCKKLEAGDSLSIFHNNKTSNHVNLPQSIMEENIEKKSLILEPNIIIIDTSEETKCNTKWKKNNAVGDASSCSGDGSVRDYKSSQTGSLSSIFKQCMGTPRHSMNSTPTYVVSTNYSDSTVQDSARKSEIESVHVSPVKYYSNTEVKEREIKTINPAHSEISATEDFYEIADVKSYKSMLLDFSSGIRPTRSFPIHFDDLETIETKEQAPESATFKEKASELLQSASSRLNYLGRQYKESSKVNITRISHSKNENIKNTSLIDVRKYQQTNINYYLVGSSSESCAASEEGSIILSEVHPSEIQLNSDQDDEDECCNCFGSLRLL